MKFFLSEIKLAGIKNIKKPIKIVFNDKKALSLEELDKNNVKAIYGPNGSGKSAIVHGFDVLSSLLVENDYLLNSHNKNYLYSILNRKSKNITIQIKVLHEEEIVNTYNYEVVVGFLEGEFYVLLEKYSKDNKTLIEINNGKFINAIIPENLKEIFNNKLEKSTFNALLTNMLKENNGLLETLNGYSLTPFLMFFSNIMAMLDTSEKVKEPYSILKDNNDFRIEEKDNFKYIKADKLEVYEKDLKKKEMFLKIFKPEIKGLSYDKKLVDNSYYEVSEYVLYDDYMILLELESTGIKKLINLYAGFKHLDKGGLLIVDELDSHINDIYLLKLIEFSSLYTNGQLIFTTHNTSPMTFLRTKNNAIDFLTMDGKLISWKQIGNYSPARLYQAGMIENLPFNLTAEDFIRVFHDE